MLANISLAALVAGLAAVARAQELIFDQSSNPVTRPLNEIVPACQSFEITWTPTTAAAETIAINLLKGQTLTLQPAGTLVAGIPNTGSYTWTPASSLEATPDATGYGLQVVIESTGHFQYSTQFGISTAACTPEETEPEEPAPEETPEEEETEPESATNTTTTLTADDYGYPTEVPVVPSEYPVVPSAVSSTLIIATSVYVAPSGYPYATGAPAVNSTLVLPTVPGSLAPSATGSAVPPEFTGAAAGLKAGLGLVGAVAGLVFVL